MYEKFKSFLADDSIFTALLLILVGTVSFGLGRQSAVGEAGPGLLSTAPAQIIFSEGKVPAPIRTPDTGPNTAQNVVDTKAGEKQSGIMQLVASKSGTKYHLSTCPGASQIKEENKIYFDSIESAEAAGYSPAANCKGL